MAVDIGRGVAGQKQRRRRQLFHAAPAPRRRAVDQPVVEGGVGHQRRRQLGFEVSRRDAVDRDAMRRQLHGHRTREHLQRAFAGGVGRGAVAAELAHHRAGVDDAALAARHHAARHRTAEVERAVDVGVHHCVPIGVGHLGQRLAPRHAGVVDQHMDRPDLGLDRLHRGVDSRRIGDVEGAVMHLQALAGQHRGGFLQTPGVARIEHHRGASLPEAARNGQPDAGGRTGHESHTAVETKSVGVDHRALAPRIICVRARL